MVKVLQALQLYDFDRDTLAITHAASAIAALRRWRTMTPELLLLAALHDDAVRALVGDGAEATVQALSTGIEHRADGPDSAPVGSDGWTHTAQHVAFAALLRAARRGHRRPPGSVPPLADEAEKETETETAPPGWGQRTLDAAIRGLGGVVVRHRGWIARGDLLHALATTKSRAADHLTTLPHLYGKLDEEDPPVPGGDAWGSPAPLGVRRASVVLDDDATTRMDAVVTVLVEGLGLTPERAQVAMYRVHFRGADRVVTLPWDDATEALTRARAVAAGCAPALGIRLVAG